MKLNSLGHIAELEDNEVFVFGSNFQGRHGSGAAKDAMRFGAKYGIPMGPQGQTYAIITKDMRDQSFVGWDFVKDQLRVFIKFAYAHPSIKFYLTPIATGLSGQSMEDLNKVIDSFRQTRSVDSLVFPNNVIFTWRS